MKTENNLVSFEHKRLARLLRQISLAYIRRELGRTQSLLGQAIELVAWADRPEWSYAQEFLEQWKGSVRQDREGVALSTAPAAWIHLAQELASLLESDGDWIAYLKLRWKVEDTQLHPRRRIAYAAMGISAIVLGALVVGMTAQAVISGEVSVSASLWQMSKEQLFSLFLTLGRMLGALLMLEHGYYWAKKALQGNGDVPSVVFLPSPGGLTLLREES